MITIVITCLVDYNQKNVYRYFIAFALSIFQYMLSHYVFFCCFYYFKHMIYR